MLPIQSQYFQRKIKISAVLAYYYKYKMHLKSSSNGIMISENKEKQNLTALNHS